MYGCACFIVSGYKVCVCIYESGRVRKRKSSCVCVLHCECRHVVSERKCENEKSEIVLS